MLATVGVGDLHGMADILPGMTHGITVLGHIIHGTDLPGVGADSIVPGITVPGMDHPGDGVAVTTGGITEVTMDLITIITEVTILHRTDIHLMAVLRLAGM